VYHQYPINPDRVKQCSHSHIMLEFNTPRRHSHRIYSSSRRADRHRQVRDQKDLRLDVGVRGSGERGVRLLDNPSTAAFAATASARSSAGRPIDRSAAART
jgi:hypothetical protein